MSNQTNNLYSSANIKVNPIKIIELYGAPGAGKTVLAADLYTEASKSGMQAKLLTEYVKKYADRGIRINPEDQLYIAGCQSRMETDIYGKYDIVFLDTSVLLCAFYAFYYSQGKINLKDTLINWENYVANKYKITRERYFLKLNPLWFKTTGRYENLLEALEIEKSLLKFLQEINFRDVHILEERNPAKILHFIQTTKRQGASRVAVEV